MAHTKRPKSALPKKPAEADPLNDEGHIEKLRNLSNTLYLSIVQQVPDARERAFVIAIIAATFLMNVSDDPEFHDDILRMMITTMVEHPPYVDGVFLFPEGNGGKPH